MRRKVSPETTIFANEHGAVTVLKHSATVRDGDGDDLWVSWEDCEHLTCRGRGLTRHQIGEMDSVLVCRGCGERFYLPTETFDENGFLMIPEEPLDW